MSKSKSNPGKIVETRGPISCITRLSDSRGRCVGTRWFDVPIEEYGQGNLTGARVAGEFFQALQDHGPLAIRTFDARMVLSAAFKALGEVGYGRAEGVGQRGAAVGFLSVVEAALRFAADDFDMVRYAETRAEQQVQTNKEIELMIAEEEESEKAAFVARMKAGKTAKAAREACNG